MPKRVDGKCPDCGIIIRKRYGKLICHFTPKALSTKGPVIDEATIDDICDGSGKRVPTHDPWKGK